MVARKKESGQMVAETAVKEKPITTEEVNLEDVDDSDEDNEEVEDMVEIERPDLNNTVERLENEYSEEEKPFLEEAVNALLEENVQLDDPNFNLLVARKVIKFYKASFDKLNTEKELLAKKLETFPVRKVATKTTSLQSYVQDAIIDCNSALEYLTICGASFALALEGKLNEMGIAIIEDSPMSKQISIMKSQAKSDTRNALASTIRAFSGIRSGDLVHNISTRNNRKDGAKGAIPRWLIDEAVEEIVSGTVPVPDESTIVEELVEEETPAKVVACPDF